MPEPGADPHLLQTRRVAWVAIGAGLLITALKFGVFAITGSVAVLSDAVESIANIAAALVMLQAIRMASMPPDRQHPYGRGNVEFMAIFLEGALICAAAIAIVVTAILRYVRGSPIERIDLGFILMIGVSVLTGILAWHVWRAGRTYDNATLVADGKHLATDVFTTLGVTVGLLVVHLTGWEWVDSAVAVAMGGLILLTGYGLLRQGFDGLLEKIDPEDDRVIRDILDDYQRRGRIAGYHKVRHRHTGPFHWVDMHLQIDATRSIADGHALASEIEGAVERALGQANATAHIEPG